MTEQDKLNEEIDRFENALEQIKLCYSLVNEAKGVIYGDVYADSEELEFLLDDFSRNLADLADLAADMNILIRCGIDPEFAKLEVADRHEYLQEIIAGLDV